MSRTRIKPKRARYPSPALLAERAAWAASFDRCWMCGSKSNFLSLQTHEMASRAQAPLKWAVKQNYFRACQPCHERLGGENLATQLCLKAMWDESLFDMPLVLSLRGRGANAITFEDLFFAAVGGLREMTGVA